MFTRWWETQIPDISTFDQWMDWFSTLRLNSKQKDYLQATFFSLWWHVWAFRIAYIFGSMRRRQNLFFDNFVSMSFSWVNSRGKPNLSWVDWLKSPSLCMSPM